MVLATSWFWSPFAAFLELILLLALSECFWKYSSRVYTTRFAQNPSCFFLYSSSENSFFVYFVVVCVTSTSKSAIASGVRVGREVTCYSMKAKKNPVTILLRYIWVDDFTTLIYQNVYSIASCFFIGNIQVHCRRCFYLNSWDCGVYRIYIRLRYD